MGAEEHPGVSAAMAVTARALRVDAVTAEIVAGLRDAGVRSILLKGPTLAAWLYADGTARPYGDTDLLVPPETIEMAERVLRDSGFRRLQPGWQEVSWSWHRRTDEATVDLHSSLWGVQASSEALWRELSAHTEPRRVGGLEVEVPSSPALAMHVALHAAQHGSEAGTPHRDLDRALATVSEDHWRQAAVLAARLDASAAFGAGLGLSPDGAALAGRLGLAPARAPAIAMHAEGAAPLVLGLEHLATSEGVWARLRFAGRKLAPSPAYMRRWSGVARRGPLGLVLAYLWRPLWMLGRAPRALVEWRRARRA